MKKEELIGKKVRGFRFEDGKYCNLDYAINMDDYIGKVGLIVEYNPHYDSYTVKFNIGTKYDYPAERIEHHLVDEENGKTKVVCTNTICQGECGECNYMEVVGNKEPTIEVNYNHISVRICEDNSLIGYYTEDCGVTSFGKTFDELLRNLQHAKKAIEEARERLAKEDLERFEKSLDQSAEEFINDANRHIIVDNPINTFCENKNSNCRLNYCDENGCQERQRNLVEPIESLDPLDDLPIIGDGVLMEVSIDRIDWFERYVFGKSKLGYILAWEENSDRKCFGWIEARPISKTKISRKEFEQKFEIID